MNLKAAVALYGLFVFQRDARIGGYDGLLGADDFRLVRRCWIAVRQQEGMRTSVADRLANEQFLSSTTLELPGKLPPVPRAPKTVKSLRAVPARFSVPEPWMNRAPMN